MGIYKDNKKIGRVFHGSREINKIYQGDKLVFQKLKPHGYIEIEVDSTSGSFRVPFGAFTPAAQYSFKIYVNGSLYGTTTFTSNSSTGTGYNITGLNGPTAVIMITPTDETVPVGWGRCFGYYMNNGTLNMQDKYKLLKVLNDPDYAHLSSETNTDNFRMYQYYQCTNLTQIPDEDMPDTVTTIGNYFRQAQYGGCTSLTRAAKEYISSGATTIGIYFRQGQYQGCTSLTRAADEYLPESVTQFGQFFRQSQYQNCTSLTQAAIEAFPNKVIGTPVGFRQGQYSSCTSLIQAADEVIANGVTIIADSFRREQYYACTGLTQIAEEVLPTSVRTIANYFRQSQYASCYSLTRAADEAMSSGLTSIGNAFRRGQYDNCSGLTQTGIESMPPSTIITMGSSFRSNQYNTCPNLRIGNHIHAYGFSTYLNNQTSYYGMFRLLTANPAPDTVPRYYTNAAQTATATVTSLIPTEPKDYLRNRVGISNYNTINNNWKSDV